jgi:osmotically-inducible protein OsmY
VFDTGKLTYAEVARLIADLVPERDRLATGEARQKLAQRAAAARVKAELMIHPEVFVPTLEVFHNGQAVVVKGVVKSAAERKHVMEVAQAVAGDERLDFDLHYRF